MFRRTFVIEYFLMKNKDINFGNPSSEKLNILLKYYQAERYLDAEKLALSITKEFPKHIFAWRVLGIVLKKTGRINEALHVNQKSLQLEPMNLEANFNLGNTLQQLGRLEEAEACYRKAISIKSDYTDAYNNLGVTLGAIGRLDEAMNTFLNIIELNPNLKSHLSLIELLTIYDPQEEITNPIIKIVQEIKETNLKDKTLDIISNENVIKLIRKTSNIIKFKNAPK